MSRWVIVAALAAAVTGSGGPRDIQGHWTGTSTCVVAAWNSACNNELVVYDFEAGADSDHVLQHAAKLVNGVAEPMGDLPFSYDAAGAQWNGDFHNERVSIRWSYRVKGDSLEGEVRRLPSGEVGRHVVAVRR
jgi:hypothetical protein